MTMTEKEGFRYPVFTRKNYTKDYVVEMSPSQIPEIGGIAIVDGELKDLDIVEEDICGDRSKRGNKVVIVLNYKGSSTTGWKLCQTYLRKDKIKLVKQYVGRISGKRLSALFIYICRYLQKTGVDNKYLRWYA